MNCRSVSLACLAAAASVVFAHQSKARELDFLEDDSRFTGGEYPSGDPTDQAFDFGNQYKPAANALRAAGFSVIGVTSLTLANMTADSDAFYFPTPTDPTASTYPLTSTEISTVEQYVATGDSVIFNLSGGVSQAMTNNLLSELGLSGHEGAGNISGRTSYPMPDQGVIDGNQDGTMVGANINSYTATNVGYFDSLGTLRSMENVDGLSVLPYFDKGDSGSKGGAYFFVLDPNFVFNYADNSAAEQDMLINLSNYAVEHWSYHYVPASVGVPEPTSTTVAFAGVAILLIRRRGPRSAIHLK